jgi:2-iminobutanoate/2-iminopropanoate deaminase
VCVAVSGLKSECLNLLLNGGQMAVREEFRVEGLAEPISHYTDAVRYGDLLFVSGVAPLDEKSHLVGDDDVAAQARQVFLNMKRILEAAGTGFDRVLKVTVYLTNVADRTKINPIRQEFFGAARPASTLIGVSELAIPGMKVEVEAVVAVR